jgi:hypothetical protein
MFTPQHFGLFFTTQHVELARKNAEREPFAAAFTRLRHETAHGVAAVQLAGLRYRFLVDGESGEIGLNALEQLLFDSDEQAPSLNLITDTLLLAHSLELLRDHPALVAPQAAHWRNGLHERVEALNGYSEQLDYLESLWLTLLNMATGVVLEDEAMFLRSTQIYRDVIQRDISPRGHIEPLIARQDMSVMLRTVLAVKALVLMAELASHVGVDLWGYEVRGVSVLTGALYPIYYFYVTDKWKWEEITPEEVQAIFRTHGGYLEIVNKRHMPRDMKPLLEDMRPIYDPLAGGLPTLSHGVPLKRGLFG